MLISIMTLIFSLLIQGLTSNYLGYTYADLSIFSTVYVLIALLILNPYFENKKKYFLLLIIFGLIIDITYTHTLLFNVCLFIMCYYISKCFHFFFPYNLITISVSNTISIFAYHIVSFIILTVLKYDVYSISNLLKILGNSILMTIIYSNVLYIIIVLIIKKKSLFAQWT